MPACFPAPPTVLPAHTLYCRRKRFSKQSFALLLVLTSPSPPRSRPRAATDLAPQRTHTCCATAANGAHSHAGRHQATRAAAVQRKRSLSPRSLIAPNTHTSTLRGSGAFTCERRCTTHSWPTCLCLHQTLVRTEIHSARRNTLPIPSARRILLGYRQLTHRCTFNHFSSQATSTTCSCGIPHLP